MPEYKYRAQDQNGKIVKGRTEAADDSALQRRFHDEGLTLLEAVPVVRRVALKPLKKAQLADKTIRNSYKSRCNACKSHRDHSSRRIY